MEGTGKHLLLKISWCWDPRHPPGLGLVHRGMPLQNFDIKSLWAFPFCCPKFPQLANLTMSAEVQPSSIARWPISATCVAESRPKDHSSSNLVHKGLGDDEDVDDGQLCSSPLARAISASQPLSLFGGLSMVHTPFSKARHLLARLQKLGPNTSKQVVSLP